MYKSNCLEIRETAMMKYETRLVPVSRLIVDVKQFVFSYDEMVGMND